MDYYFVDCLGTMVRDDGCVWRPMPYERLSALFRESVFFDALRNLRPDLVLVHWHPPNGNHSRDNATVKVVETLRKTRDDAGEAWPLVIGTHRPDAIYHNKDLWLWMLQTFDVLWSQVAMPKPEVIPLLFSIQLGAVPLRKLAQDSASALGNSVCTGCAMFMSSKTDYHAWLPQQIEVSFMDHAWNKMIPTDDTECASLWASPSSQLVHMLAAMYVCSHCGSALCWQCVASISRCLSCGKRLFLRGDFQED